MGIGGSRSRTVADVIRVAEHKLSMARQGLDDFLGPVHERRIAGITNLIVHGRSVTFVLQNLKSHLGDDFSKWYDPKQEEMKNDEAMKFFVEARNAIEKRGKLPVAQISTVGQFSFPGDMHKFGPPPKNAKRFFFGDETGGSGWIVSTESGEDEKVYFSVPAEVFTSLFVFIEVEPGKYASVDGKPVDKIASEYIDKLTALVNEAKARFLT